MKKNDSARKAVIIDTIRHGLTQRRAAMRAGISEDTLCLWKKNDPEFSERLVEADILWESELVGRAKKHHNITLLKMRYKEDYKEETNINIVGFSEAIKGLDGQRDGAESQGDTSTHQG